MTTRCTLFLISLKPQHDISEIKFILQSQDIKPLIVGSPHFWAGEPKYITRDKLLSCNWSVAIILLAPESSSFSQKLSHLTQDQFTISFDPSDEWIAQLRNTNENLLHPDPESVPPLPEPWTHGVIPASKIVSTGSSEHATEPGEIHMTSEYAKLFKAFGSKPGIGSGAVSMLNLLTCNPDGGRERYLEYVTTFSEVCGGKRNAMGKIFGPLIENDAKETGWEYCAVVHYPTVWHFAEMVTSPEYLEVETRLKKGALKDTCILCVSELDV